ncbi:unnamed protein product [Symbiodinium natans]|uniref:Uncharacterized protein n=1 Tax=Symbiodinium natans TaxID=878477 RepID=A0A812IGC5_9DINO|nr:unnamed protein product [Symbiodinium natans]
MATTSERIKNLDCTSSVWVTKDQRESGLKYLVEKHARQGAAITARTLSGLVVNAEEEAARQEAAKTQKRQREGQLNELVEEMAKADGEVKAPTASLFSGLRQAQADAKKKKPSVVVVKKPKVAEEEVQEAPAAAAAPEATGLGLGAYDSGSEDESEEEDEEESQDKSG